MFRPPDSRLSLRESAPFQSHHPPPVTRHPPPVTRHPPPVTRHPPPVNHHPPPATPSGRPPPGQPRRLPSTIEIRAHRAVPTCRTRLTDSRARPDNLLQGSRYASWPPPRRPIQPAPSLNRDACPCPGVGDSFAGYVDRPAYCLPPRELRGHPGWTTSTTAWHLSTTSSSTTGTRPSSDRPGNSPGSFVSAGGPGCEPSSMSPAGSARSRSVWPGKASRSPPRTCRLGRSSGPGSRQSGGAS